MIHEILSVGPLQCNCSVIGDETTRAAMVIDPGDDIEDVLALIQKHNLKVKQIVITHAHIDHVGGAMKLRAATGAPILLNQNDYALLKMLEERRKKLAAEGLFDSARKKEIPYLPDVIGVITSPSGKSYSATLHLNHGPVQEL